MTWLILAILAPFIWSIANYVDKFILTKAGDSNGGSEGLIVLSSLMSLIFALGLFFVIKSQGIVLDKYSIFVLILSGIFEALYIYFYFLSLEIESASTVIALFQFAPVFGILFGYIFIHEIPTGMQLVAMLVIFLGTICLVVKKGEFHFNWKVIKLMTVSTLFVGLFSTFFKMAGESVPLWTAIFWQYIGIGLVGIAFLFSTKAQKQFTSMLTGSAVIFSGLAEILNIGAVLALNAALVLAPVGLVLSISSVQPVFTFAEGVLLAFLLPKIFKKDKPRFNLQYLLGISLVVIGGFLIY
ncbi:MAG: EamA family transporter [bacterium]